MKILIRDGKIIGTATDVYEGPEEFIQTLLDIDLSKLEWCTIVDGQLVFDRKSQLAALRYEKETSGITLASGVEIATDRQTQSILSAAYNRAKVDPAFSVDWKGANGWITLTAEMIIYIGDKVFSYVQACFSHERELSELLDQDSSTDITVGWPVREGL